MSNLVHVTSDNSLIESFFDKKITSNSLSFEKLFNILKNKPSPYLKKVQKNHFSYFVDISKKFIQYFPSHDKFATEKKELNKIFLNLINYSNYEEINDFFKNGFQPNSFLTTKLFESIHPSTCEYTLSKIHEKNSLNGLLAQIYMVSLHFNIYHHKSLTVLGEKFPNEYIPPEITENFNHRTTYKNVLLNEFANYKSTALEAIHSHNLLINPNFSMELFSHALNRLCNDSKFHYINADSCIGSVLTNVWPYVKSYLSNDDTLFILDMVKNARDQSFTTGQSREIQKVINEFYETLILETNNLDKDSYKEKILKTVQYVYSSNNEKELRAHIYNLKIENDNLLPQHTDLIEKIKSIHNKISAFDECFTNQNIDKINNLTSKVLPLTIQQYQQVDIEFRDKIKNTEGKNSHELLEESLKNILEILKDFELQVEQHKVNELSITNRKNRII